MTTFDVDAWLDSHQRRRTPVTVSLDYVLVAEHQRLDVELQAALLDPGSGREQCLELARRIVAFEKDLATSGKTFVFEERSHEEWADLMRAHPPTDEQLAKERLVDHNPDTFPVAAIAACAVSPTLTEAQARRMRQTLGNADFHTLWEAVVMLNREVMVAPKSQLAGVVLQVNNGFSATPARKVSPARRSSAASAARSRRTTAPKGK